MKRIKQDVDDYEMRRAKVQRARKNYPCDDPACASHHVYIIRGDIYAFVSTGQRYCSFHFAPTDVEEVTK